MIQRKTHDRAMGRRKDRIFGFNHRYRLCLRLRQPTIIPQSHALAAAVKTRVLLIPLLYRIRRSGSSERDRMERDRP